MSDLDDRYSPGAHIERLKAELEAANKAIDDLNVQCKFWRQCAEHAVKGWNALEEKTEAAREALNAIEGNLDAARELLGGIDEWAPPDIVAAVDNALAPYASIEITPGVQLRVVEEESPLECCKLVDAPAPGQPPCTCGEKFRTGEDWRDHLPCPGK